MSQPVSSPANGRTCAVLVVDLQNAYFEAPPLKEQRSAITAACNRLTAEAARRGHRILFIGTTHERDKSTWTLNMLEENQGFAFRGSEQAGWLEGLDTSRFPELWKTRDSAFFGTDLYLRLKNWNVDSLILAGVDTENCIAQTAADAFAHNFDVVIASDVVASPDPQAAEAALAWLEKSYRQKVLDLADVETWLSGDEA
ncbi:isochorismatase family cysteine hydrolase [Arthrobacter sp. ISL-30]|uniref:cysteine hydrolase family protein n=1 Tax=Arthrobacter sp. ISL-30 TaxID=2819109 RepID=UPI0027E12021|nr:isochorismatase family cysteine hydrolase [Arthrobacter sp. ISL-30]